MFGALWFTIKSVCAGRPPKKLVPAYCLHRSPSERTFEQIEFLAQAVRGWPVQYRWLALISIARTLAIRGDWIEPIKSKYPWVWEVAKQWESSHDEDRRHASIIFTTITSKGIWI